MHFDVVSRMTTFQYISLIRDGDELLDVIFSTIMNKFSTNDNKLLLHAQR